MNSFKRAWLSVSRRKGKSLLLFAILFILGNVIAGAFSIKQATQNVEKKIRTQLGAVATIELDYEALSKKAEDDPTIHDTLTYPGIDVIEQVGQLPSVKYYDFTVQANLAGKDLQYYIPEDWRKMLEDNGQTIADDPNKDHAFKFEGVNYAKVLKIEEGQYSLVEGRVFTDDEIKSGAAVGLISKDVAEMNSLKLGDTVVFTSNIMDYSNGEGTVTDSKDYPVEIIGIFTSKEVENFKTSKASTTDSSTSANTDPSKEYNIQQIVNTVIVPNELPVQIAKYQYEAFIKENPDAAGPGDGTFYQPIYVLKNPDDIDTFKQDAQNLLPEFFYIQASSDQFDQIAGPVSSMSKLSGYVLLVAIAATILIITLVVLLFLRDRKHELGIYLSFGESKGKVFLQILTEVMVIAVVAITLAVFTGNLVANSMTDTLMTQSQTDTMMMGGMSSMSYLGLTPDISTEQVLAEYKVSLTPAYIGGMYLIGLGTVLVATAVPLVYIMRLNPKKIMM